MLKFKKFGFVSIEVVITAALILAVGLIGINLLANSGNKLVQNGLNELDSLGVFENGSDDGGEVTPPVVVNWVKNTSLRVLYNKTTEFNGDKTVAVDIETSTFLTPIKIEDFLITTHVTNLDLGSNRYAICKVYGIDVNDNEYFLGEARASNTSYKFVINAHPELELKAIRHEVSGDFTGSFWGTVECQSGTSNWWGQE